MRQRRDDSPEDEAISEGDSASRNVDSSMVSVTDLEKVYGSGDDAVEAVNGVSFDIEPGTAVGVLGPNGAGKTTVIKSILSLIVPTSGRVEVDDIDVHRNPSAAFERLGAMLEGARNTYWRLTVRENLEIFTVIGGNDYRKQSDRIDELLAHFNLEEKEDEVVRELSRGQKQKVSLACTMVRDTDVVFLDEPTLGLDIESSLDLREELRRLVRDDGTTVLLSSHDMDVIQEVCDRVIVMQDGEVVANDTVDDLLDLFNTQTYEITVEGQMTDETRTRIEETFGASNFERRNDTTRFEANVTGDQFYELVDTLRDADLSVASFDAVEPDLEDVFLHITDETTKKEQPLVSDGGERR